MSISIANNNISSSETLTLNNKTLSDVAFSGSYDDLIDKPNVGSGGALIDSWHDGVNWYRKYDDGFIEQGGYKAQYGFGHVTVNFEQPFSSSDNISIVLGTKSGTFKETTINCVKSVTATSVVISNGTYVDAGFYWRASGY